MDDARVWGFSPHCVEAGISLRAWVLLENLERRFFFLGAYRLGLCQWRDCELLVAMSDRRSFSESNICARDGLALGFDSDFRIWFHDHDWLDT